MMTHSQKIKNLNYQFYRNYPRILTQNGHLLFLGLLRKLLK